MVIKFNRLTPEKAMKLARGATAVGRGDYTHKSPSKFRRDTKRKSRYIPKGRPTTRLPKIQALAAACIKSGEDGITKLEALKIAGYKQFCEVDNMLITADEQQFYFWEYDPDGENDRRTSKGRGSLSGRIGLLSWPAGFTLEGDHVAH